MDIRRIVAVDNDGGDIFFSKGSDYESFIDARLTPMLSTGVTTLLYTTQSSGFSVFSHPTKYGTLYSDFEDTYPGNCAEEIIRNGSDCLKYASRFCRENNIQIFWNFRMNDTHDAYRDSERDRYAYSMFRRNVLKHNHPEYMIGSLDNIPKFGAWSAVDYGCEEIRQLAFKFVEEILSGWDIDGISLDFFRHPVFFKETGNGEPVTEEHVVMMTELVGRISEITHKYDKKLWVRVPDNIEYARFLGLDVVNWLAKGYIDYLCTTSYIKLEDWSISASLAHKYGIQAIASLDECRMKDSEAKQLRIADECWLARAAEAFGKGMDGVMFFNLIVDDAAESKRYHDLLFSTAKPEELKKAKKRYFVSYRGVGSIAGGAPAHEGYQHCPVLNPSAPSELGSTFDFNISTEGNCSNTFKVFIRIDSKAEYKVYCKDMVASGCTDSIICMEVPHPTGDYVNVKLFLNEPAKVLDVYIET